MDSLVIQVCDDLKHQNSDVKTLEVTESKQKAQGSVLADEIRIVPITRTAGTVSELQSKEGRKKKKNLVEG